MVFSEMIYTKFTFVEIHKYVSSLTVVQHETVIDLRDAKSHGEKSLKNWITFPVSLYDLSSSSRIHLVYASLKALINSLNRQGTVVLICKDGGLISKTVWEIIRSDFNTQIYKGGFRQLQKSIRIIFEKPYSLYVLKGPTGTGKTEIISALQEDRFLCLNLETIARHAGSVFGNIKSIHQPKQFEFEFQLAELLSVIKPDQPVIVEDEHANLGEVSIPRQFWAQMQNSSSIYISVSKNARIHRLVKQYAGIHDKYIENGILILADKLGHQCANELTKALKQKNYKRVAEGLIDYYDSTPGYAISYPGDGDFVIQSDDVDETVDRVKQYLKRKSPGDRGH